MVLVWATFFASIILAFTTFIALRYKEQEKIEKDKKEQKELEKQKKAQAKQESQSKPEQT